MIAFLGSWGHCIGMCGGIVLAYSSKVVKNPARATLSHLLYGLGRVSSYAVIGAISGALGAVISLGMGSKGALFLGVGFLMILFGVALGLRPVWLAKLEYPVANQVWYRALFVRLLGSENPSSFYFLGVLNGLLPCGFVYLFALSAASSASLLEGALIMGLFGIATIPALFGVGFLAGVVQKSRWRGLFLKLSALAVVIFGVMTMMKGYGLIAHPEVMKQKMEQMHAKERMK